jgi:hypothetical protein
MRAQPVKRILVRLMVDAILAVARLSGRFDKWHPGTAARVIDGLSYKLFAWSLQRKFQVVGGVLFSWEQW